MSGLQTDCLRALFEANSLGIVMVGPDCLITEVNRSAEQLSGWTRAELVGRKACAELLSRPDGGPLGCPGLCSQAAGAAAAPQANAPTVLRLRRQDDTELPVGASAVSLSGTGETPGTAYFLWDASERTRLESEAAARRRQAEGLQAIGREMAALSDTAEGMERVLHQARDLFAMDLMAWGLLDEAAGTIGWQAASGTGSRRFPGTVLPVADSIMGQLLTAGRPFVTHNLAAQLSGEPEGRRLFGAPPLHTAMAVPLRVRDTWYGVLLGASAATLELTDENVILFTHLGSYLATAVENRELLEQVQHMAALEERQRLARELHDGFGQILTYLSVRNLMVSRLAGEGQTEAILAETAQIKQVLQEAHTDVRRSIFELKESGQPRAPLTDRWREFLQTFQERSGIDVRFTAEGKVVRLNDQSELQLTRILQEALANVRNHSGARSVTVRLNVAEQSLHLTIADDGCGFDSQSVHGAEQHHFGLGIMRERARAVGGELEVQSMRGHGATVTMRMPLRAKEE